MIAPIRNYLLNVEIPNDGLMEQQMGDAGEDDDTPFGGATGGSDDIFGPLFDADRSRHAVEGGPKDASTVSAPTVTPSSSTAPLSSLAGPENLSSSTEQQLSGSTSSKSESGGPEAPAQTTTTTTPSQSHSSSSTPDSQLTGSSSTLTASTSPAPGSSSGGALTPTSSEAKPADSNNNSSAVALTPQQQQAAVKNAARLQYNIGVLRHIQTIFGHLSSSRLQYYTPRSFWKHFKYASTMAISRFRQ